MSTRSKIMSKCLELGPNFFEGIWNLDFKIYFLWKIKNKNSKNTTKNQKQMERLKKNLKKIKIKKKEKKVHKR